MRAASPAGPSMGRTAILLLGLAILIAAFVAWGTASAQEAPAIKAPGPSKSFDVLVFSKTAGFRHDSIPAGIAAIKKLGRENGFRVDATEDAAAFTDENLAEYETVVWLSTTGDVLNEEQQAAFERYIRDGGGYVGIHAAADTEYEWEWYGRLVGAYFDSHPAIQPATIKVADKVHPSTKRLPERWRRTDEWYNYRANPRGRVHVLATLDESTYSGGNMGYDHPIAWCQEFDGGRSWYTGGGHTKESFSDRFFLRHILGGIRATAGVVESDCGATVEANYEKVTLAGSQGVGEPMGLAVLPDGRVLHTSRTGEVRMYDPETRASRVINRIEVYTHDEEGLQSIAVDPNFEQNHWVYLYYSPPLDTPPGEWSPENAEAFEGHMNLSRFKLVGDSLDLSTEQVILQVPTTRGICCHVGGHIDFDDQGNLYLSTGDDTNPFASDGYAPIDERPGREPYDAQRTAANTNDLRGKLLRIKVRPDGSYTIPEGNLFGEGGKYPNADPDKTRPEIYAMGLRNPFRFAVDGDGTVYLGDYSPDASQPNPERGPAGHGEWMIIEEAGNYGWPYCAGPNMPYRDYDFATGRSGPAFDCEGGPVNDSPNNTGLRKLPPAVPPDVWYPYGESQQFPELGTGGIGPMGGPVYDYDPDLRSETKFPAYYDGVPFFYEWTRDYVKEFRLDEEGRLFKINPFLPNTIFDNPMDMEFGPDGSLYVLEYGDGYFSQNPEAQLARIDYVKGARSPVARASAEPTSGQAPLTVQFSSEGSYDPDPGDSIAYAWDFQNDGTVDSTEPNPTYTYTQNGVYTAQLTVTDSAGKTGVANVEIVVGNTSPEVTIEVPPDGGFFDFGDTVPYRVSVTDPEDGQIDCSRVEVQYILGHDEHGHPLTSTSGCEGTIQTVRDEGHGEDANVFGVIAATYTDEGGGGVKALTGQDEVVLQPKTKQAEHFTEASGVQIVEHDGAAGGRRVGNIEAGDWIAFDPVNLLNIDSVSLRVSSGGSGGTIEFRWNAPDGPVIGTANVPNTGGWDSYTTLDPVPLDDPGGSGTLYLVFSGGFDVDQLRFNGEGVAQ